MLREEYSEEKKLQVFEDVENGDFIIKGTNEEMVDSFEEAIKVFE